MGLEAYQGSTGISNDAVGATPVQLGAGPQQIIAIILTNTTGATAYVQFFDKLAANVSLGTDVPKFFIRLGANQQLAILGCEPITLGGSGASIAGTTAPGNAVAAVVSVTAFMLPL